MLGISFASIFLLFSFENFISRGHIHNRKSPVPGLKVKVKQPYFILITSDSNNKLINLRSTVHPFTPPPQSLNAPFQGYFKLVKATQRGEKLKQGCDVTSD